MHLRSQRGWVSFPRLKLYQNGEAEERAAAAVSCFKSGREHGILGRLQPLWVMCSKVDLTWLLGLDGLFRCALSNIVIGNMVNAPLVQNTANTWNSI